MGLESVSHISDLVITNPPGTDPKSEGDDHLRNIKIALKADFPNVNAACNPTPAEFNKLVGSTLADAMATGVFGTNWINGGSRLHKLESDKICLQFALVVNGGAPGVPIYTLPVGYRPAQDMRITAIMLDQSANTLYHTWISLTTAGVVQLDSGFTFSPAPPAIAVNDFIIFQVVFSTV